MWQIRKDHICWPCFAITLLVFSSTMARPPRPADGANGEAEDDVAKVRKLLRESRQLVNDPEEYDMVQAIGLAYARAGDVDLALQTMESIKKPIQIDVGLRRLAVALAEQGDSEGAERIVKKIKDDTKGYAAQEPIAWLGLGNAYAKAGERKRAGAAYAEAARAIADKSGGHSAAEDLAEVAEAQSRLGDQAAAQATFKKAVECAVADKDRSLSAIALMKVAETQARTGAAAEALKSLQSIKDATDIDRGTGNVAVAQAQRGEFKEARQTAGQVKDAGIAARTLLEIARVQVQKKELDGATESLGAAIRRGEETTDAEWVVEITQDVASLHVEMGDKKEGQASFEKALQILDKTDGIRYRELCYRKLAVAMGKAGFRDQSVETFKRALKLAGKNDLGIKDKELQDVFNTAGVCVIAKAQAEAGLYTEAILTAKTVRDDFQRDLTLGEIGERQAERGDVEGALETAGLLGDKRRRAGIDYAVATAQLDGGKWQAALKRGLGMDDGFWKALVLRRAAKAQAVTDVDGAMQWCEEQKSPEVRARALLGIAEGMLERRQQKAKPK
jgi:tetratricopeptide (TPR) repeat protein